MYKNYIVDCGFGDNGINILLKNIIYISNLTSLDISDIFLYI